MKICKNDDFWYISGIFGRKKIFSKIGLSQVLGIPNMHLCAKNQKKLMMKSQENAKNQVYPAFLAGKKCISKLRPLHFRYCNFASVCKIS